MAPVHDFRHVELDKIGRGKRIVKPPGGECSDIFGVTGGTGNGEPPRAGIVQLSPRKPNNYMQSTIFSPGSGSRSPTSPTNGHSTPTKKPNDTQDRLFGSEDEATPKKAVVDRMKSKIFEQEVDSGIICSPKSTPVRRPSINPITGTPMGENGYTNGHSHTNGNGTSNGHSTPESPTNGSFGQRMRVPPGGPSSGIF